MSRQVVRSLQSHVTHLADVDWTSAAMTRGVPYRQPPPDTRALCGVRIRDGAVMSQGTRVWCVMCRTLNEKDQPNDEAY